MSFYIKPHTMHGLLSAEQLDTFLTVLSEASPAGEYLKSDGYTLTLTLDLSGCDRNEPEVPKSYERFQKGEDMPESL